ncbi:DUF3626 domain-containing protein [Oerskovia sp. Sa1BUA8]|uniref:DUF3626 domain-containing protein n=1 Tax=Oerskovia douganii TaxID=2762210 RepID=A0A9D5UF98_9CELL|nr:DUF3626 domain-containing protein [Oerskovia douganii]MBE7699842.1 DUF3626 domain-containing protein [Oerskovia douganii]
MDPRAALEHVAARALDGPPVHEGARIALHFHPDADLRGEPTLGRILDDGAYLSQFATGTSNGGLTAASRGDRWRWEQRIFGGLYDDVPVRERPVYGALTLDDDPYGPAPRFGSAWFRLRRQTLDRATFAYPDSVLEPEAFGVAQRMGLVELLRARPGSDLLDRYVEAHVHGGVAVPGDVEALVLDPSYREVLGEALRGTDLAVEWHPGYVVDVDTIARHADYRGADVVGLAARVAEDGVLTPAVLGRRRGAPGIDPQMLKRVWHCLARFGRAAAAAVPDPAPGPS